MNRFPDIERTKDSADRDLRLQAANEAVGQMRVLTAPYQEKVEARTRVAAAKVAEEERILFFSDGLDAQLDDAP